MSPDDFIQAGDLLEVHATGSQLIDGRYEVISTGEVVLPGMEILYVRGIAAADLEDLLKERLSESGETASVSVRIVKPQTPSADPLQALPANTGGDIPRIQPGDKINIVVADEKQLTGEFLVNSSGRISYPLLGELQASNLTVDELQGTLRSKIASQYIKDPRVSVSIVESRTSSVDISGRIMKPGNYVLTEETTLLRLISQAGGLSGAPSATTVQIVRHENGRKRALDVRFAELVRGAASDPVLKRGDIIFVEELEPSKAAEAKQAEERKIRVSVFGHVENPGNYRVPENTTLVTLLAEAGGFASGAATGNVKLVRKTPTGKVTATVNAGAAIEGAADDPVLTDGDVVTVREAYF